MPSYEDDLPTDREKFLLENLRANLDEQQRYEIIVELKNLLIGSNRCKIVFFRVGFIDLLFNLLKEYSLNFNQRILIEIFDCLTSFIKSTNSQILDYLFQINCLDELFHLLINKSDYSSNEFIESILRCIRSFFPSTISSYNSIPFVLQCDENCLKNLSTIQFSSDSYASIDYLFSHTQMIDILVRLSTKSLIAQLLIIEIFCCLCINNQRQEQLVERNLISIVSNIFINNLQTTKINDNLCEISLKFFCALSYENAYVARLIIQTNESLCEIIGNLLRKIHRPLTISYYASKFFVHLCKTKILAVDHPSVALLSLTTLIHLSTKSILNQSIYFHIECLETLIYFLNGNSSLHHLAMYTEQFLSKLFLYIYTPSKLVNENVSEHFICQIRALALTLLAILSSHFEDIRKRIADDENLIPTAIDCYRSSNFALQLSALRLFHGLSRSVQQLQTTFNDTIGEILLEGVKSDNMEIVKISSCVISNIVLDFSTCQTKLLNGGILNILLSFLTHTEHDLRINSIWALRNLSYLAPLNIKQDIINGLTIDRIYSLLEQCTDEQFLICLLSLLRNLFDDKDTDAILPIFNPTKLLTTLQQLFEKTNPEEIRRELDRLINHLNSSINPVKNSSDSVNSTCRTSLFPEYACEEMDHQLDCS